MDPDELKLYKEQLKQVNGALSNCRDDSQKEELLTLKNNIEELLALNNENEDSEDDEYARFMLEIGQASAINTNNPQKIPKDIEGMKCRAPHKHQWGNTVYHNAIISTVIQSDGDNNDFNVKIFFTNPTQRDMKLCPYYLDSECKFSEEKCRFSHGKVLPFSQLKEYVEPQFDMLQKGSLVLAKSENDGLWYRALVREMNGTKCVVRFEIDRKNVEITLENILPLNNENSIETDSDNESLIEDSDVINESLIATPVDGVLGSWEKHTKGIGSKLMNKMGYVIGTGLGKNNDGRIEPVTAVILPQGKSLDHCMRLKEESGNDKDLFNAERKLKRMQKQQEKRNEREYARKQAEANSNVFNVINTMIAKKDKTAENPLLNRSNIKNETVRNLNIKGLTLAENIKKLEREVSVLNEDLTRRGKNAKNINEKLNDRVERLEMYKSQARVIKNELELRDNKKKMTVF